MSRLALVRRHDRWRRLEALTRGWAYFFLGAAWASRDAGHGWGFSAGAYWWIAVAVACASIAIGVFLVVPAKLAIEDLDEARTKERRTQ